MINNIFYEELDDLIFDLIRLPGIYKKIDCEEIGIDGISKIEQPTLFKNNESYVFYNAQKLEFSNILELLNGNSNNILAFCKIDKRTKAYKKIVKDYKYEFCLSLKTSSDKKDFIRTTLIEHDLLHTGLTDYFLTILPENKLIIFNEIDKFARILKYTANLELAKKAICTYDGNTDIFELVNALFDRSLSKFYFYLNKIINEIHPLQIYALLSKKLMYLIFLSLDNHKEAKSYIFANDYYLKIDTKLSKKIGSIQLFKLHKQIEDKLFDVYEEKDLRLRLLDLFNFFNAAI